MKSISHQGIRWIVADDVEPILDAIRSHPGSTVKESAVKRVSRHEAAGRVWYQKIYRHEAVAGRPLKFFFKRSQARQEWELAAQLASRSVPVVRHVALGERWSATGLRESILITEGFSGVPLNEAKNWSSENLRAFVRLLHDRGVYQADLHPANILVNETTGAFALVDLHGTRVVDPMSQSLRDENLVMLSVGVDLPLPANLQPMRRQMRQELLAARARRCLKQNRDFIRRRLGQLQWQCRRELLSPAIEAALSDPDATLLKIQPLFKHGSASTVGATAGVVIKRKNFSRPLNLLKDFFRRSKARDAFLKAYHLELTGVRTARGIAAANERRLGFLWRSYFVMEAVPGGVAAHAWPGDRGHAIRESARLFARLHDEGFTHRDLKTTNVLLDTTGRAWLIDLDGLAFVREVPAPRALVDVQRFDRCAALFGPVSNSDRLRFLRHYCKARGLRVKQLLAAAR